MSIITLTDRTYQRLRYEIESPGNGYPKGIPPRQSSNNWQHVRVTGAAVDCDEGSERYSGGERRYYPAVVELWDATNEEALDLGACLLMERHDYPLVNGNVYPAQQSGVKSVCGTAYVVFVTAIPIAGLDDSNASDDYYDYYDGSVDSADSTDAYTSDVEYCDSAGPGGEVTLPLLSCDDDGNQCIKLVKFRSSGSLQICIEDPNDCD